MNLIRDREFSRKLLSLVIPLAFQQFMLQLVSASDAFMLGVVGQSELSAVSLAAQVQFVLGLFLAAVTIGTNIFAAQYWGKGDVESVEKFFAIAMRIAVPVSALFTVCTASFPAAIMRLFTSDAVLIENGACYLRAASPPYLFCGISQVCFCIMKNSGQAGKSTVISSVCVLFDILLNAVLIFGLIGFPRMEIVGAAISTAIARGVETCWVFFTLMKMKKVRLRLRFLLHVDRRLHRDYWKYTSPVLADELVWGIGTTMYAVIMGHLGEDAVAANAVADVAKKLVVCFCSGLASGGGIIVGNELGTGALDKARVYGAKLCKLAIYSGLISGGVLIGITPLILRFTSLTDQSSEYLLWMLVLCSIYMVGKSFNSMTVAGIFCAGGDSRFGFLCDTVTLWCITIPLGLIAAFLLKLPVVLVYLVINADEFIKMPAVYRHYKKYIWVRDLTAGSPKTGGNKQ